MLSSTIAKYVKIARHAMAPPRVINLVISVDLVNFGLHNHGTQRGGQSRHGIFDPRPISTTNVVLGFSTELATANTNPVNENFD